MFVYCALHTVVNTYKYSYRHKHTFVNKAINGCIHIDFISFYYYILLYIIILIVAVLYIHNWFD